MDAKPLSVGQILSERQRFVVPIYQRTYSWTIQKQLETLMQQLVDKAGARIANQRSLFGHYMGALLVIPEGEATFGRIQPYYVVDGQQRLTTFHLLYAALRDLARFLKLENVERQLADLLVHPDSTPMQDPANERYKLQPTKYDRASFRFLVDNDETAIRKKFTEHFYKNGNIREGGTPPMLRAWFYFRQEALAFIGEGADDAEKEQRLLALSTTLFEDFRLIVITLGKDDDAQVIFETLNHGGAPLTAMDLVRNDVFHRAASRHVDLDKLLEEHWSVFETPFWKEEQTQGRIKKPRIDFYLAHTLAAEQGTDIVQGELYASYKEFIADRKFESPQEELQVLTRHTDTYKTLVAPQGDEPLAKLAIRLNTFDVGTAYPLVFVIADSDTDDEDKARLYDLIASYIYRRAICGLTPKSYNKTFVKLAAAIKDKGVSEATLAAEFATMTGDAVRFPDNPELVRNILNRQIYGSVPSARLRLLLEEIELASRGKHEAGQGLVSGLTIEHILPDAWTTHWPLENGKTVPADKIEGVDEEMLRMIVRRDEIKHTLGNLTLLTQAGNQGNDCFEDKKPRLRASGLTMNIKIADLDQWREDEIRERGKAMADLATNLWPVPGEPNKVDRE